ncbi:MAG: InlB B-repeat-containing protein [Flavobacteriaceae bacterium]|tara:strand:- start:279 stop:1727 length:1449 start_codon:yes stop_codon:yes gene_type:complete
MQASKSFFYHLFVLSNIIIFSCSKGDSDSSNQIEPTPVVTYEVSISSSEGGSVNTQSGTYNAGTVLNITATPSDGYEFIGWTGSNETSMEITITVNSNIQLTANFQLIPSPEFTVTTSAGVGGTVSQGGTFSSGTVVSVVATPSEGFVFTGWTGSSETSSVLSITISSDLNLTANFQEIPPQSNYYSSGAMTSNDNISEWFDRSIDIYGIKLLVAGEAGGQPKVSDEFAKKVAQVFKLLINKDAPGINQGAQEKMIKILLGETGFHEGFPTGQRIGYGNGDQYSPNPLKDDGCLGYSGLCSLENSMVLRDMIWYMSPDNAQRKGDNDIVEVFEHALHTLQSLGTRGAVDGSLSALNMSEEEDISGTELFLAMKEAVDNGVFGIDDYGGDINNQDRWPLLLVEYQYLLTFGMWEVGKELWEGGSLAPEWSDNTNTPSGIQQNNPLGYALFNNYISPVLSKPDLSQLRSMFQDNDGGQSGYVPD